MAYQSLKEKTISGLSWTFTEKFLNQIIQFIVGIVLARLLSPQEYGLTGMVAVFLVISNVFISSGFGEALVRKNNATDDDYSTVFVFNILTGIICYVLLVSLSGIISRFFNEPALKQIILILGFTLIINSFGLIPRVYLWKRMDFRSMTLVSLSSGVLSGILAIFLALKNFGVWSLVWKSVFSGIIGTILLFFFLKRGIKIRFRKKNFKELFGFSSRMLLSELISQVYNNIYYLIIGKYFSARDLGLYTRADNYKDLPSRTLDSVVQSVSYPVLSEIKDDQVRLKKGYKKLIKSTMYIAFILMFGLAGIAENFINGLIGNKWAESVPYLQLLCFAGMLYPLHSLNLNVLNVMGRSDLFLRLEIIKKSFAVPIIFAGIFLGIMPMIAGMIIISIISFFINGFWSGKLIKYNIREQMLDIFPSFLIAFFTGLSVYTLGYIINLSPLFEFSIQLVAGALIAIIVSELFKPEAYIEIKTIVFDKAAGYIKPGKSSDSFDKTDFGITS